MDSNDDQQTIYDFGELNKFFAQMSDKQYLTCRDAGYTKEELKHCDFYWYQLNRKHVTTDKSKQPYQAALPKQLEFLFANSNLNPNGTYQYNQCRNAIREIALKQNDDERYVNKIKAVREAALRDNAERKNRARKDKET